MVEVVVAAILEATAVAATVVAPAAVADTVADTAVAVMEVVATATQVVPVAHLHGGKCLHKPHPNYQLLSDFSILPTDVSSTIVDRFTGAATVALHKHNDLYDDFFQQVLIITA